MGGRRGDCSRVLVRLEAAHEALQTVRIEDMQASRPEDVQEILATIPDKKAFNEQMQYLIFGSLIAKWADHDILCRLRMVGRFVRMSNTLIGRTLMPRRTLTGRTFMLRSSGSV